jgi:hypothetical protein
MAKKSAALLDDIMANIPRKGTVPWFEAIDNDIRIELDTIRTNFHAGRMGPGVTKTGLARAISKSLEPRGVQIGHAGVMRWLESHQA